MESNETCPKCGAAFAYETSPNLYLAVEHQRTFRVFACGTSETGQSSDCQIACLQRDLTAALADKERAEKEIEQQQYALSNTLANINDTCRSRGFTNGPSGTSTEDRVIALAQAYDSALADAKAKGEMIAAIEAEFRAAAYPPRPLSFTKVYFILHPEQAKQ